MYEIFDELRIKKGVSVYRVSKETGIPQSTLSAWKAGEYTPKQDKLQKIANYLGVSLEYLSGNGQKETPVLTEKDERDIKVRIDEIMEIMESQKGLMFDGNPLTPEALNSIRSAMELGMAAAKTKNMKK